MSNRLLAAAIIATALVASVAAQAAEKSVILTVENMSCASCPYIVGQTLSAVPGVDKVVVSKSDKTARVTYDDAKATVAALISATTNAGYPSSPVN